MTRRRQTVGLPDATHDWENTGQTWWITGGRRLNISWRHIAVRCRHILS